MQVPDAVRLFLRSCRFEKNLSELTMRAYETDLCQFSALAQRKNTSIVAQITSDLLQEFVEHLKYRQCKDVSIRRKLAALRAFLKFLERNRVIDHSPFAHLRTTFKQERRLPTVLRRPELMRMMAIARAKARGATLSQSDRLRSVRDYALLELLFYTGARIGEILKLDVDDCDLTNRTARIKGKGRRERVVYIGCKPVILAVQAYLRMRTPIDSSNNALFLNRTGRRLSIYSAERIVNVYAAAAGVSMRVTPHVFRHSMATMMLENGADLRSIQEILGHASIRTTEIYTHVSTERKRQVMTEFHPRQFLFRRIG